MIGKRCGQIGVVAAIDPAQQACDDVQLRDTAGGCIEDVASTGRSALVGADATSASPQTATRRLSLLDGRVERPASACG